MAEDNKKQEQKQASLSSMLGTSLLLLAFAILRSVILGSLMFLIAPYVFVSFGLDFHLNWFSSVSLVMAIKILTNKF